MSKTLIKSLSALNGIIRHNLTIVFLMICVLKADIWGLKAHEDPRIQMIKTFTNRKYDALNQTDIDTFMSFLTKSVKHEKSYHYMSKLRDAMQGETRRLEANGHDSDKDWKIQAFRPAAYDDKPGYFSLAFTECALCKKSWQTGRCNVTRVELLVHLIHGDSEIQREKDGLFVEINGHTVNSSRGIMDISRAVIFDLSNILLEPDADRPDGVLNITVKKQPCHYVLPKKCMLYEYCNINSIFLDRFRAYSHKVNKSHTDRAEEKQPQINVTIITRVSRPNRINGSRSKRGHNSTTDVGHKQIEKLVQPNQSLVLLQQRTLAMSRSTDMNNLQTYNSSQDSDYTDSKHAYENGSSSNVPSFQNTRSLREHRNKLKIVMENSKQPTEQQPQKETRQSANPFSWVPSKRNVACANSYRSVPASQRCNRHSFHVNFRMDLPYIIYEPGNIDVGYCSGTCGHTNDFLQVNGSTAHAAIMNRLTRVTPRVTCSPQGMRSMTILRIKNDIFTLETWHNVIVDTCRCT